MRLGNRALLPALGHKPGPSGDEDKWAVASAVAEILGICKEYGVACGHPHVNASNIERAVAQGFRWLMATPTFSFATLEKGRTAAQRV